MPAGSLATVTGTWRRAARPRHLWPSAALPLLLLLLSIGLSPGARAASLTEARTNLIAGHYSEVISAATAALEKADDEQEEWPLLLGRALLTTGQYEKARDTLTSALQRFPRSLQVRLMAREAFQQMGDRDRAAAMLDELNSLATMRRWAYRDSQSLIALGRTAMLLGADPRQVLEQCFDRAKRTDPDLRDVYLASGELALQKSDFALAAKAYQEGLKKFPGDPDFHFGLAQAYAPSDRRRMMLSLNSALEANTNHIGCHLILADHLIDGEEYQAAEKMLGRILEVNPWLPEAHAFQAVIEHLRSSLKGETRAREKATRFWPENPAVDHLIGKKLSQKYRFAEGAACQRQALKFDEAYLPAKLQLAQDLLRLGQEEEGWRLARQVHQADAYNVTAFNLATLEDTLRQFATLTNRDFILRMSRREADLYGARALELLQRAKDTLCAKYGLELTSPTTVEVFPEQKDFGVRTFGMPDNPGFLGVCFGHVITANSPASQGGSPANWEAVLWHEFCHVVTLQLTRNKMPRWLSEGISVHEELQANPAWGQAMNPHYREMILEGELSPVGDMSAAFLAPKSDLHLQFAYYQSALVVEFVVKQFGHTNLVNILGDLADGVDINNAIQRRCAPLEQIEKDFAAFARQRAQNLAPNLDWTKPERAELAGADADWFAQHPTNYYGLLKQASDRIEAQDWTNALPPLLTLLRHYPNPSGPDNPQVQLAFVYRKLGRTNDERQVLRRLAELDADALEAFLRLMQLDEQDANWPEVERNAGRFLAVNPLLPQPYQFLGRASEALAKTAPAIAAYRTLLRLEPTDPADVHFRLAGLLHQTGDPDAKRQVLQALEEAPRFRQAHALLLRLLPDSPEPAAARAPTPKPATPDYE